jgi:MinD superfamily P-loop ATPase
MDRSFWTQEQCNHCGLCQRICPVKNIQLVNGMPSWLHHCEQCLACLHWCPQEAIQFGKSTISRQRYHHPEVKQEDLL